MGLTITDQSWYSPEEYFKICETTEMAYEYEQGRILAMGTTTEPHNDLIFNITSLLKQATKERKCKVHFESIQLEVVKGEKYYLPDVMLSCDETDFDNPKLKRFPVLLVEVLSPGTEARDRGEKFHAYMKIPSLIYYLLVSQAVFKSEVFAKKENGGWEYSIFEDPEDNLHLSRFGHSAFSFGYL